MKIAILIMILFEVWVFISIIDVMLNLWNTHKWNIFEVSSELVETLTDIREEKRK